MSVSMVESGQPRPATYQTGQIGKRTPQLSEAKWGYSITPGSSGKISQLLATLLGRIVGASFLGVAAVLWVMPDSMLGPDVFGMKLIATLLFSIVGSYLVWAARGGLQPEIQVDLIKREVRRGHRSLRGEFVVASRLGFEEVGSVFLQRVHEVGRPSRLFLRVGHSDTALEIARGAMLPLERLRDRLARELTPSQENPLPELTKLPPFGKHFTV